MLSTRRILKTVSLRPPAARGASPLSDTDPMLFTVSVFILPPTYVVVPLVAIVLIVALVGRLVPAILNAVLAKVFVFGTVFGFHENRPLILMASVVEIVVKFMI